MDEKGRALFWHEMGQLQEQLYAVIPISVLQVGMGPVTSSQRLHAAAGREFLAAHALARGTPRRPTTTQATLSLPPLPLPSQMVVLAAFFGQSPKGPGLQVMGLILAILGLAMFMEGLRVVIMVRQNGRGGGGGGTREGLGGMRLG